MKKKILVVGLLVVMFFSNNVVFGRRIGYFENFRVTYSGGERYTGYLLKATTGRDGVINLRGDTGDAWITATMRNMNGLNRGWTNVQRGKRATFSTPGSEAYYYYRLGLKKRNNTGGGAVSITGSWSPDSH